MTNLAVQAFQPGKIRHYFLCSRALERNGQQVVVAHGRDRQDTSLAKGLVQHHIARFPGNSLSAGGRSRSGNLLP